MLHLCSIFQGIFVLTFTAGIFVFWHVNFVAFKKTAERKLANVPGSTIQIAQGPLDAPQYHPWSFSSCGEEWLLRDVPNVKCIEDCRDAAWQSGSEFLEFSPHTSSSQLSSNLHCRLHSNCGPPEFTSMGFCDAERRFVNYSFVGCGYCDGSDGLRTGGVRKRALMPINLEECIQLCERVGPSCIGIHHESRYGGKCTIYGNAANLLESPELPRDQWEDLSVTWKDFISSDIFSASGSPTDEYGLNYKCFRKQMPHVDPRHYRTERTLKLSHLDSEHLCKWAGAWHFLSSVGTQTLLEITMAGKVTARLPYEQQIPRVGRIRFPPDANCCAVRGLHSNCAELQYTDGALRCVWVSETGEGFYENSRLYLQQRSKFCVNSLPYEVVYENSYCDGPGKKIYLCGPGVKDKFCADSVDACAELAQANDNCSSIWYYTGRGQCRCMAREPSIADDDVVRLCDRWNSSLDLVYRFVKDSANMPNSMKTML